MNIIVTGGTGFLGSALVHELVQNGDKVTVIVRPNSKRISRIEGLEGVRIIEALLDGQVVLPKDNYDVFCHLAWEGERDNYKEQYKNVLRTLKCLEIAKDYGCYCFICTGSQAEYGSTNELIIEETTVNPTTSYGAAKVAAYYLSRDMARHYGIKHIWTRVFSVYGEHDNYNTLYSQLTKALHTTGKYNLNTDGLHMWNFLHETDAARALRLLCSSKTKSGIYNLASKESKTLYEYAEMLKQKINPSAVITYGVEKSTVNLNVNSEKLRNEIGEYEKITFPRME